MKITVLVENSVCSPNAKSVSPKLGLSLFIEYLDKKILFDLGPSSLLFKNANKLGVNLVDIDSVFLSHGHFDHSGGLKTFFELNKKAKVYIHKTAPNNYYASLLSFIKIYVGINKKVINTYRDRIIYVEKDTEIENGIKIFENFDNTFPQTDANKVLLEKIGKDYVLDKFKHEIVLALQENNELVLFTGCSHSGIVNMVRTISSRLNNPKIKAVFGGFHTMSEAGDSEYTKKLTNALGGIDTVFYTGHCTGKAVFESMKNKLGDKIKTMNTGEVIEV